MMALLASAGSGTLSPMAVMLRLAVAMAGIIAVLGGIMVRARLGGYARGWWYSPPVSLSDVERRRGRVAGAMIWLGSLALIVVIGR